jgi:hypothetical protein
MRAFETGHEIFDKISNIRLGSLVTVLDETFFESLMFLNPLLSKVRHIPVTVFSSHPVETPFQLERLDVSKSLNDINLKIADYRERSGGSVIIHHYLPRLLLKVNEDAILRMLEYWSSKISDRSFVEFCTLPRGAYPSFEKKLQAVTEGVIDIRVSRQEEVYQPSFSFLRGSKPEYHLVNFPYVVKDDRLLIRWGDEFTDKAPTEDFEEVRRAKSYLMDNLGAIRIIKGSQSVEESDLPSQERLLFSHLIGRRLDEVQTMFPDRFDEILETISRWRIRRLVSVTLEEKRELPPLKPLSKRSKLALKIPVPLAILLLRLQGTYGQKRVRTVPFDSYIAIKNSAEALVHMFMPSNSELAKQLPDIETFFQEVMGRMTALEHVAALGEDPRVKPDMKYVPQFVSLTLFAGYGLRAKVKRVKPDQFEITVPDCFICRGVKSDHPYCMLISGPLQGVISVAFKESFICQEIKCRAMGDRDCTFLLRTR